MDLVTKFFESIYTIEPDEHKVLSKKDDLLIYGARPIDGDDVSSDKCTLYYAFIGKYTHKYHEENTEKSKDFFVVFVGESNHSYEGGWSHGGYGTEPPDGESWWSESEIKLTEDSYETVFFDNFENAKIHYKQDNFKYTPDNLVSDLYDNEDAYTDLVVEFSEKYADTVFGVASGGCYENGDVGGIDLSSDEADKSKFTLPEPDEDVGRGAWAKYSAYKSGTARRPW